MKTDSRPVSAFEVHTSKKSPSSLTRPSPVSRNKIKKLKRKQAIETKKLKKAGITVAEELNTTPNTKVIGRQGAVKTTGGRKLKTDVKKASNGIEVNKKQKKRKRKGPSQENGTHVEDSEFVIANDENDENKTKDRKINRLSKARGNGIVDIKSMELRKIAMRKKIAEVKKLVMKKETKKSNSSSVDKGDVRSEDNFLYDVELDGEDEEDDDDFEPDFEGDDDSEPEDDEDDDDSEHADSEDIDDIELVGEDDDMASGEEQSDDELLSFDIETFTPKELKAVNRQDSKIQGQETFQWIIKPHTEKDFFSKFWEKKPVLVKRKDPNYYKGLFSTQDFDKILNEQVVMYSKNLDVTSYSDGKRETHNPIGQAHPPVVWDYYNNGCSLRMLNPQTFHPRVWKCLSSLQEYFNCFCGANIYLTPPDTQGFAPHWDDIEAFILQLEGKKRWRVYEPRSSEEVLPDYSSPNLTEDSIGKPVLETVLEAGDLLYFPKGYIHQGNAVENEHSLHITISAFQKNAWGHYLEKLLPLALSSAITEDVEFRQGLPRNYLNYMGIVHMENECEERNAFKKKVCDMVMRMLDNAPFDAVVDQRGASFMHDCLPPYLTPEDKKCSVYGGGEKWCAKKKKVINRVELQPDTPVRLIRGNCIRLAVEDENVKIYHCLENSREYHQEEPQYLEVTSDNAPAVECLIHTYPSYIAIEGLPLKEDEDKMTLASGLWERGLLVTAHPLDAQYDD